MIHARVGHQPAITARDGDGLVELQRFRNRIRDAFVADRRGERQRLRERNPEQLAQPQVRDVAIAPGLDYHGALVVACDPRAEQIKLRRGSHGARDGRLLQRPLRLHERAVLDLHQRAARDGVEVGLRDIERDLRARGIEPDIRRRARRGRALRGGAHAPGGEQILRERDAEDHRVRCGENLLK